MKGVFLVFEGPDGGGTTTHITLLAERLKREGYDVLHTFQASDGPIGTFIRAELMKGRMSLEALQLLFCADRSWHVENVIKPALSEGKIVLCDRYRLSTVIYGTASGLDAEWLRSINDHFIAPDATVFTIPPLSVCLERLEERVKDMLESKLDLQRRVYDLYLHYASTDPTALTVDTSGDIDATQDLIWRHVAPLLPSHARSFQAVLRLF